MRKHWQRMAVLGSLVAISVLMQSHVATAQMQRTPQIPRRLSHPNPDQPVIDRIEIISYRPATGDRLKSQQEIALQFSRQSLCPEERIKEFAWVTPTPERGRISSGIYGWFGGIEKMTRTLDGWLVSVAVHPRLTNGGTAIYQNGDQYVETYEYSAGSLRFLKANVPPPGGRPRPVTWN
jgi:hypothetical protein